MVEFDVQLTKDFQPIIYHDFHVLVEVASRNGNTSVEEHQLHEIAIKDLRMAQLNLLHFEHVHVKARPSTSDCERVIPSKEERQKPLEKPEFNNDDNNPFPALETVFKTVDEHTGFNIEIKYPMLMKVRKTLNMLYNGEYAHPDNLGLTWK